MNVKAKILLIIGILKRERKNIPLELKKQIYFAYIHSNLNYLNVIWGNANKGTINSIKILQNKAVKHVLNYHWLTPTKKIYAESGILNFINLKKCNLAKFMYKLKNNLIKSEVTPKLNSEIHNYSTRHATLYHIDPIRTNFGKFATLREAIHLYNSLPEYLKQSQNYYIFNKNIKNYYLLSQQANNV